jgi:hypothetical protein
MNTELDTRKEPGTASHNGVVLRHLRSGKRITAYEAVQRYGIYRLAARVNELRRMGHAVKSEDVWQGSRHWAVYWMEAE